jgi:hypothetical protein
MILRQNLRDLGGQLFIFLAIVLLVAFLTGATAVGERDQNRDSGYSDSRDQGPSYSGSRDQGPSYSGSIYGNSVGCGQGGHNKPPKQCPKAFCTRCVVDPSSASDCSTKTKCVKICESKDCKGRKISIYAYFEKKCCTYDKVQWCVPQDLCSQDGCQTMPGQIVQCEKTKDACDWTFTGFGSEGCK